MLKLLVILFIIKLYARINIYKHIGRKYGQDIIKIDRLYEKVESKYVKIKADIDFIRCCEQEAIIPTSGKVNLSIQRGGYKLKKKITKLVIHAKLAVKHHEMKELRKQIRDVIIELKSSLILVLFQTVIHQVGIAVKSKIKCIKSRREKKLDKFLQREFQLSRNDSPYYIKNTVHNFSSDVLSSNEEIWHIVWSNIYR